MRKSSSRSRGPTLLCVTPETADPGLTPALHVFPGRHTCVGLPASSKKGLFLACGRGAESQLPEPRQEGTSQTPRPAVPAWHSLLALHSQTQSWPPPEKLPRGLHPQETRTLHRNRGGRACPGSRRSVWTRARSGGPEAAGGQCERGSGAEGQRQQAVSVDEGQEQRRRGNRRSV